MKILITTLYSNRTKRSKLDASGIKIGKKDCLHRVQRLLFISLYEPTNVWLNSIHAGRYSFEVNEADGLESDDEVGGQFYFTCLVGG